MKIWAIVVKEAKEIFRDVGGLVMMFVVPLTMIVVFNYAMGGAYSSPRDNPLRVPVANLDKGELGERLVARLDSSEWIAVERYRRGEEQTPLTREDATATVEGGRRNQALVIPEDFSAKVEAGEEVEIDLIIDPAVPSQYTGPVEGALQGALFSVVLPAQIKSEIPGRIEGQIEKFERDLGVQVPAVIRQQLTPERIYERFIESGDGEEGMFSMDEDSLIAKVRKQAPPSVKRESFPSVYQQTASGYTVMFVFFIIMFIGSSYLDEKHNGTFRRLLAAPVGRYAILAGKLLPALLLNCLQVAVMFAVSIVWFGIDLGNSPLGVVLITVCLSLCACGLGLLVATLFHTQTQLSGMGVLIVLVSSALSGAMIPRFIMPSFMQQLSLAMPQTWAIEGYLDILARGAGLADVLPNCGVLLLFAAAFYVIAIWRFRFE